MTETATSSNNKAVSFRRPMEREMSWTSQGITHSSASKGSTGSGKANPAATTPRLNADGQPVDGVKPKKVKRAARKTAKRAFNRGMISEKAAKRHLGDY